MTNFATLLPAYLSWLDDDVLTERLLETLMITCSDRLTRTLHCLAAQDAYRAEQLQERIGRLPDDALVRMLMAPEIGFRLGYHNSDAIGETARFIEESLTAEEVRVGDRRPPDGPCWSALGDLCFSASPDGPYVAPRIGGIVIDFESPWVLCKLPHITGEAEAISPANRATALDRIGDAVRLMNMASVRATVATRSFTQAIIIRSDPSRPDFYTSASTTLCLGRAVMRNPFVACATPSEVADGLVHEAIHCICDLTEIHDGRWLPGGRDVYHVKVASPWTERQLDIHTYLQACWVWYGLWHFWARAIETDAIATDEGLRCLGRAFRGFVDGAAVARLAPHRTLIDPAVFGTLEEGQAVLLTRMKNWERDLNHALENLES